MEPFQPLESPRVEQVGGVLSRGEDTDGERTDDEVDFPSSFVSQHQDEPGQDSAEELEVTGEGTAGGPFGLKKVLFVRKKSEKGISAKDEPKDPNKPQETFKDRFSKLGAGVGERFAALGSIMQEKASTSGAPKSEAPTGVPNSEDGGSQSKPHASGAENDTQPTNPKLAMEYFQEYEMTFTSKPEFSVVESVQGKGAVVSWGDSDASASAGGTGAVFNADGDGKAVAEAGHVPPSGAVVVAVAGESTVDAKVESVAARLMGESAVTNGQSPENASADTPNTAKVGHFPLVVRFRERTGPRYEEAHGSGAGSEVFRSRMKAMATGFGNLFQVKETGSVVRDGSEVSGSSVEGTGSGGGAAAVVSTAFVLSFAAKEGTAKDLPFSLAEMIGGQGVVVSAVAEDYTSAMVRPDEAGVSAAGTAAVFGGQGVTGVGNGAVDILAPGTLLLRVAGQNVEGMNLKSVRKALEAAAAEHLVVKILFRRAPPIYRARVAAELHAEGAGVPHVHVGTWQPVLKRRAGVMLGGSDGDNGSGGGVIGIGYGGEEWEDVRETMARAQRFVNGFRSVGIRVDVVSMQTVTLPRNVKSAYAGTFEGRLSSFQQAVRIWFSFPDERTVTLQRPSSTDKLGLMHVDTMGAGSLGSWVMVTASDASPCAEAGIPVGENSILTHVNGFDVSPAAYRSLAPLPFGEGEGWAAAVLPAMESAGGETITLTFV